MYACTVDCVAVEGGNNARNVETVYSSAHSSVFRYKRIDDLHLVI
jgi:hypothetical protein